ncbi:MAG: RnfABCDGE type electron transport complex subunit D [Treponema sp.]|nr:RnfABCDGE type electron transport complex subunit D [Treponema sp.]
MKNKNIKQKIKPNPVSLHPFVYKIPSVSAITLRIMFLLLLQIAMLFFTKSFRAVNVVLATTFGAVSAFTIIFLFRKTETYTIFVNICQGMMIGLLLPETYPVFTAFLLSFSVILISKYLFVNIVTAWINIVCMAVIIAWFIGKSLFPDFLVTTEILLTKNPSYYLIQNGMFHIYEADSIITKFLNNTLFDWLNVNLPEGYISLLFDNQSIIPAFRFTFLNVIASIVLFSDDSYSGLIPAIFITVYAVLVRIFMPFCIGGALNQGDIILALSTSGTMFTAVFLLQWFGTHPMTFTGKLIFAFIAGLLAFGIVGCGTSPIGMIYTVIICNLVNLLIRLLEEKKVNMQISKLARAD